MRENSFLAEQLLVLNLVRSSLWMTPIHCNEILQNKQVFEIAARQGVVPIVYRVVKSNFDNLSFSDEMKKTWKSGAISEVLKQESLLKKQQAVISLLNENYISAVVHKGASIARYYPDPSMRSMSDIDLLVSGRDYENAVEAMKAHGYIENGGDYKTELGSYHTGFHKDDVTYEIHYSVSRIPDCEAGHNLERIMSTAVKEAREVSFKGYSFLALSYVHQAVALIMHTQKHLVSTGIGLRQLCDWMVFLNALTEKEWRDIQTALRSIGLLSFTEILTKTCCLYLGLPLKNNKWISDVSDEICRSVMLDIFRAGNSIMDENGQMKSGFFMEDVGHFRTPFHGKARMLHQVFYRINRISKKQNPLLYKVIIPIPILWVITSFKLRNKAKSMRNIYTSFKIASDRRRLYDSMKMFEI